MIHSLSGGVIAQNDAETFAKVEVDGAPYWYLARQRVQAGDRVEVPFNGAIKAGTVLRVELCTPQTSPVPFKRAREIERVIANEKTVDL